jgi:DNA primase
VCGGTDRFAINTSKQVFLCRQCDASGDVIAMVQHFDGCDFRSAIEQLDRELHKRSPTNLEGTSPPLQGRR